MEAPVRLSFPTKNISMMWVCVLWEAGASYVLGLDKIFIFVCSHTGLSSLTIHVLQLCGRVLSYSVFNDPDNLIVIRQIGPMAFQPDHVQSGGSLQRPVDVKEFPVVLGLVKVRRHTAVAIRLGCQEVRI